jgi:hypothetical protein
MSDEVKKIVCVNHLSNAMKRKMVAFRSTILILVLLLILGNVGVWATSKITAFGGPTATVKGSNVNVRQAPDVNSKVVVQLQDGEMLKVLEMKGGSVTIAGKTDHWYRVEGKFGTGWVFGAFLDIHEDSEAGTVTNLVIDEKELCDGIGNLYECYQILEKEWLRNYTEYAKRSKGKLFLKMDDGKWKTYEDDIDPEMEQSVGYSLTRVFETPRAYFLDVQHYEGGACILINRKNGSEFEVLGRPLFSQSNTKFVCFSIDLQAGYDPTGIEIWSWNNGKCTREFDLRDGTDGEDERWGPTGIQWISETMIRVARASISNEAGEIVQIDPIFYEFSKGKWEAVR